MILNTWLGIRLVSENQLLFSVSNMERHADFWQALCVSVIVLKGKASLMEALQL